MILMVYVKFFQMAPRRSKQFCCGVNSAGYTYVANAPHYVKIGSTLQLISEKASVLLRRRTNAPTKALNGSIYGKITPWDIAVILGLALQMVRTNEKIKPVKLLNRRFIIVRRLAR